MAKRWYVVHVFSGSEKKVAQAITEQAATHGLEAVSYTHLTLPTILLV